MQNATVAAGIAAGLVDFACAKGARRDDLLAGADIDPVALLDPDARLPLVRYRALLRLAQNATGDSGLALHFGAEIGMASLSILGLIMEASANMGEAFLQMQRYGRLAMVLDDGSEGPRFVLEQRGGRLFLLERRADPAAMPELTEEALAQLACGPRRFLREPHVLGVYLAYSPPAHADEYERVFNCPIYFDSPFSGLELHPDIAQWPVAQSQAYVSGLLSEKADALLASQQHRHGIRLELEAALLPILHQGQVQAEDVAARFGVSRSTLFRRLRDEGTSFARVLDALRRKTAEQHLLDGRLSVSEVAYLTGFSDAAAFTRAFQRWTGQTPGRYRQIHGPRALGKKRMDAI